MAPEIIVALIAAGGSAVGTAIGILANSRLVAYRIEQLEFKVDKHNNLIERTYKLEEQQSVLAEKMSVANHRIDDLEQSERR